MRFSGTLYRALNPVYAREPLSGAGAALHGGRFNPRGMAALYTSLSVMTALREANQAGHLQPTTLVSYEADIAHVLDGRRESDLAIFGMDRATLAARSWRSDMVEKGEAPTQAFGRALFAAGHGGLIVPSYAAGATQDDLNLVLFRWGPEPPFRLVTIDPENRLGRI